jgi:4-amino-4-deoxy-L-arabinose transferase-like glycosyltransferase
MSTVLPPSRSYRDLLKKHAPLFVVLLGALFLRVAVVLVLSADATEPNTYEHGEIARNLLAGKGFSVRFLGSEGPTSQQAPLYPVLLAAAYWLFGTESTAALLAVQLLQCVAGVATVYALMRLAWSLLPEQPAFGWVAGIALAVHPAHLYAVAHIQVVVWASMLLTVLLAVVAEREGASVAGRRAAIAGLLAGAMLLVEPILVLALPLVAWMFFRSLGDVRAAPLRPRLAAVAVMATVCAVVLAPWLVRNWHVHGEPVFVKSTFGYAFWQGNNPASYGTDKVPKASAETLRLAHDGTLAGRSRALWEARHETVYIDDVLLKPNNYAGLADMSEPERSRTLGRRAGQFIAADPAAYGRLCLARLRYFFLFDETNPKAAHWTYRATTVVWLFTLAIGLWSWRGWWRALWPLLGIFAVVAAFHVLTITSARFRMPLEPFSLIGCAGAVVPVVGRIFGRLSADRFSADRLRADRLRADRLRAPRVLRIVVEDDSAANDGAADDGAKTILPGPHRRHAQTPTRKAG